MKSLNAEILRTVDAVNTSIESEVYIQSESTRGTVHYFTSGQIHMVIVEYIDII